MANTPRSDVPGLSRALVDALPDVIAAISRDGRIVFVNRAWERFGRENGNPNLLGAGVGDDYLSACRDEPGDSEALGHRARSGITDVLHGARDHFSLEYPCDSPGQKRWFRLYVWPIAGTPGFSALIHREITEYERLRRALRNVETRDEIASYGSEVPPLAPRQRQVLELVAKGFSNREIAFTMGITTKTVDYHLRTLKAKLGKHRRAELVRAGIAQT